MCLECVPIHSPQQHNPQRTATPWPRPLRPLDMKCLHSNGCSQTQKHAVREKRSLRPSLILKTQQKQQRQRLPVVELTTAAWLYTIGGRGNVGASWDLCWKRRGPYFWERPVWRDLWDSGFTLWIPVFRVTPRDPEEPLITAL